MTGTHRSTDELIAETYADTADTAAEDLEAAADFTDDSLSAEDVIASHDLPAEHRPIRQPSLCGGASC